ncbi:phosphonate metabolism protein/1,5-bisphosphokinase (PRPP-forming) PhnN [Pseudomonas purpurea]|uniref:phosphonate metabolism protein/1,5-bisphosphokinase (PRPP-forming) PhnN n=1 Tax=Pseudomonas purpurea TaxID=3136737 RepID=UPI003264DC25
MPGRLIYLMGPSGSGKDSLIDAARDSLLQMNCEVARRIITRSEESMGEQALGVSPEAFRRLREAGRFALSWHANGLDYGIPVEIDQWLGAGRNVLVNGSRGYLAEAQARFPKLLPVLLTVKAEVLRDRLQRRNRESAEEIDSRLQRNSLFWVQASGGGAEGILRLDNSEALGVTVERFLGLLRQEGLAGKLESV